MISKFRKSKATKVISCYLALMILLEMTAPMQAYALTTGPTQPEFDSFTPIGTSDMVDLASGDFNYNIPIMDVGGYPLNLAYNSGISMDQEASWVGLGWNLNVGQIARQLRGIPDDFNGDPMLYENNMKDNVTVGGNLGVFATGFGLDEGSAPKLKVQSGIGIKYNSYDGFGFSLSEGLTYQMSDNLTVGMSMNASASEGTTVSPTISMHAKTQALGEKENRLTGSVGVSLNSRKGVEGMSFSASRTRVDKQGNQASSAKTGGLMTVGEETTTSSSSGSLSFIDASFTPTKRVGMVSSNYVFNLNIQGEIWGIEPGAKFTGYRTSQGIKDSEKSKLEKAFGYENSYNATDNDILDFNREKDRTFSLFTTSLPVTNNTYDLYSIQGQGISGMYRPYKSQVGYVYDNYISDDSNGGNLGIEIGAGGGVHFGVDISVSLGKSSTKAWRENNPAISRFEEKKSGNRADYEKVFFKNIGGNHVDKDFTNMLTTKLGGYDPVRFGISDSRFARSTELNFKKADNGNVPISSSIARNSRLNRNQAIQKLTRLEAENYGFKTQFSPYSFKGKHDHHTSEVRIIKDGGERYVYGRAAYNITKKEVTFDVSDRQGDCHNGLVNYMPDKDNTKDNSNKGDQYFNRITTPSYAHTYLLTSVLSSDYSDLTNNGPTDDDLGSYTKFVYDDSKTVTTPYKWRIPYEKNKANYDEGLRSSDVDNKGNYMYGEKELLYIKKIETKTHIAIFDISVRKDGYGVSGENGGGSPSTASKTYKLNKITLYSKPEYMALKENATPIKVAHFVYDYSLCQGVQNNFKENHDAAANETANQGGKLTLKKVYFTYGKSNMGMYTPYKFNYSHVTPITNIPATVPNPENPNYDPKAYDTWGNYKPNLVDSGCGNNQSVTNTEFPFVEQGNKAIADQYAAVWHLKNIELPSGGKIEVQYESDDYHYVQDKEAMQMFKVVGVGETDTPSLGNLTNNTLFNGNDEKDVLYIELNKSSTNADFIQKYIGDLINQKVYFRFLLNMAKPGSGNEHRYDYVTGYLELKNEANKGFKVFSYNNKWYASVPVKTVHRGDGLTGSNQNVNPVSKAGWNFGRQYLNRFVYTNATDENTDDLEEIVKDILGVLPSMIDIIKSPNKQLIERKIASKFIANKSWIRLMQPDGSKLGGGSRVKEIKLHDQWQVMTGNQEDNRYKQTYGQSYSYLADGKSSGVATYEPLGNKENPLVQPFSLEGDPGKLLAPESQNYIETPFGESYFPSPKVTYSKVTVSNLERNNPAEGLSVKKHATGKVVTEFYTTHDYPTIVDYTELMARHDKATPLSSLLNLYVRDHLTLSQGFSIHTNDMDGRMKSQYVFAEGSNTAISGVDYIYNEVDTGSAVYRKNRGKLNNLITTIDSKGVVEDKVVGVDFDVVNDFRDNKSVTETGGIQVNVATLPITIFIIVVPTPIPSYSKHENQLRTAVTTKHIHTTAILREKRVFDAGSSVSTKNLAWDAETGEVLVTETDNEYGDKYYSFNYPAYWGYNGMGQAAKNVDLKGGLKRVYGTTGKYQFDNAQYKASDYLAEGDEMWIKTKKIFTNDEDLDIEDFKAYVVNVTNNQFTLITEDGLYVKPDMLDEGEFTISRSGYRNMQGASMASITSMHNPLLKPDGTGNVTNLPSDLFKSTIYSKYKIVNAAAIEYKDEWAAQCECQLPKMQYSDSNDPVKKRLKFDYNYNNDNSDIDNESVAYNPYKYNIKGNWRPKVSYAYLTGRNSSTTGNVRNTGYFNTFSPFYINSGTNWVKNAEPGIDKKWKKASEITQYNPFGFEVENRDALQRHSSALYGYNYRFPVAVASNTKYSELGYDGFEDYDSNLCGTAAHFNFSGSIETNKITVSSTQAHSGKKSLKLAPRAKAVLKKQIINCKTTTGSQPQ